MANTRYRSPSSKWLKTFTLNPEIIQRLEYYSHVYRTGMSKLIRRILGAIPWDRPDEVVPVVVPIPVPVLRSPERLDEFLKGVCQEIKARAQTENLSNVWPANPTDPAQEDGPGQDPGE